MYSFSSTFLETHRITLSVTTDSINYLVIRDYLSYKASCLLGTPTCNLRRRPSRLRLVVLDPTWRILVLPRTLNDQPEIDVMGFLWRARLSHHGLQRKIQRLQVGGSVNPLYGV